MRYSEIFVEAVNKEIIDADRRFRQRVTIGDYVYIATAFTERSNQYIHNNQEVAEPGLVIEVIDPKIKKLIAQAIFKLKGKGDNQHLESQDTWVNKDYKRAGIATTMYAYARSLGNDIKPSRQQTPDGRAMWRGWGDDAKNLVGEYTNRH